MPGAAVTHAPDPAQASQISELTERLRAEGVDVIRVSYPDMIGVDRGRDVLLGELPTALEHGLAFCRAVYHTSPMGDVVPVQGGLEAGLPDITVRPDLATVTPLPWEPNAAWCLGDARTTEGEPAPESPRTVARRVEAAFTDLGLSLVCGPELEFFVCEQDGDGNWRRYADDLGNVYVVGRKGDPQGLLLHMLRQLRDAGLQVTAANHEFSPGQFEINLAHSELTDAAEQSDSSCGLYRRSLLYLVSESFEGGKQTPILGMQHYADGVTQNFPNTTVTLAPSADSGATQHGAFDDDPATMNSVITFLTRAG